MFYILSVDIKLSAMQRLAYLFGSLKEFCHKYFTHSGLKIELGIQLFTLDSCVLKSLIFD